MRPFWRLLPVEEGIRARRCGLGDRQARRRRRRRTCGGRDRSGARASPACSAKLRSSRAKARRLRRRMSAASAPARRVIEGTIGLRHENQRRSGIERQVLGLGHRDEAALAIDVGEAVAARDVEDGGGIADRPHDGVASEAEPVLGHGARQVLGAVEPQAADGALGAEGDRPPPDVAMLGSAARGHGRRPPRCGGPCCHRPITMDWLRAVTPRFPVSCAAPKIAICFGHVSSCRSLSQGPCHLAKSAENRGFPRSGRVQPVSLAARFPRSASQNAKQVRGSGPRARRHFALRAQEMAVIRLCFPLGMSSCVGLRELDRT